MELFSTNKLFKEEKYEEILALWQNDESRNRMTDWDKWYVLLSLNKQKRYQETLDAYKLLRAKRDESTETELWQRIEDTVCRALYYAHVKTFDFRQGDSSKLFKQVDYILAHSSDSPYSVKGKAALFVVSAAEEGKLAVDNASELIIRYLDAMNPSTLGREEFEYIDQQGNRRAKAPDREIWYAARAKALLKLQRYGECMACCDEALRELRGFHYSNDSWLRYRKAKCLLALGNQTMRSGASARRRREERITGACLRCCLKLNEMAESIKRHWLWVPNAPLRIPAMKCGSAFMRTSRIILSSRASPMRRRSTGGWSF